MSRHMLLAAATIAAIVAAAGAQQPAHAPAPAARVAGWLDNLADRKIDVQRNVPVHMTPMTRDEVIKESR